MMRNLVTAGFNPESPDLRLLDFGCGAGEMLIGLRNYPNFTLWGCDLESDLVDWCSSNLNAQCLKNELDPPLPYEDNSFDVINAISVFTHLSLDMQFKWAWELYRVIKPSGYLHFTAHGPAYFGLFTHVAKTRRITNLEFHWFGADSFFLELEQPINEELYKPKTGANAQGQLEVAVANTEAAIRIIFSPFIVKNIVREGGIGSGHDAYVLQKPDSNHASLLTPFESIETLDGKSVEIKADLSPVNANKNRMFRIFSTATEPGTYITEVSAYLQGFSKQGQFFDEVRQISKGTRYFGSSQWNIVEIPIPATVHGPVTFKLKSSASHPGYLEKIRWVAPHVC